MHVESRASASSRSPDLVIADRYECRKLLGQGATARVYRAWDRVLCVERAIKVLHAPKRARDPLRQRLQTEARLMARLAHPNVLQVFDVGTDGEGELDYVVMALAEESLQRRLDRLGPLPVDVAGGWVLEVLSALEAAHDAGIIHRDVKPQNILLDNEQALLADFGIARSLDFRQTRTNVALGSLSFMAPEQRIDAHRVGPAADLYAAGATLYALITGANPIDLFVAPPNSPRWAMLPAPLAAVLQRATAHLPEDRFVNAAEMAAAIAGALDGDVDMFARPLLTLDDDETVPEAVLYETIIRPGAPPLPPPEQAPRELLASAASTIGGLVLGLALWLPLAGQAPPQPVASSPVVPPGVLIPAARYIPPEAVPPVEPPQPSLGATPQASSDAGPLVVEGKPPAPAAPEASVYAPLGPGTWRGLLDGELVVLRLEPSTRRRRSGVLQLADGTAIDVRAQVAPESGVVQLDGPRRAEAQLQLTPDQREMVGLWRAGGGEAVPLSLYRQ